MTTLDYILLAVLVLGVVSGIRSGAVRRIFDIAGFVVGIILGIRYVGQLAPLISGEKIPSTVGAVIVIAVVVALTCIAFRLLGKLLTSSSPFIKVSDKLFGGILGGFEFAFGAGIMLALLSLVQYPSQETRERSFLYKPISSIVPWVYNAAITFFPEARQYSEEVKKLSEGEFIKKHFEQKRN